MRQDTGEEPGRIPPPQPWCDATGRPKLASAHVLLSRMERDGLIRLPPPVRVRGQHTSSHLLLHAEVVTGIRLMRVRGWRVFAMYSIVAGLAVLVAALGNLSSLFAPTPQTPLSSPASAREWGEARIRFVPTDVGNEQIQPTLSLRTHAGDPGTRTLKRT